MGDLLRSIGRPLLIYLTLGLFAIGGWGSFAYVTWSARQQVKALTSERERLIVELSKSRAAENQLQRSLQQLERSHEQLQRSAGDLRQVEAKLNAARAARPSLRRRRRGWSGSSSASNRDRSGGAPIRPAAFARSRQSDLSDRSNPLSLQKFTDCKRRTAQSDGRWTSASRCLPAAQCRSESRTSRKGETVVSALAEVADAPVTAS
jgi:hypothetical protein